MNTLLQKLGKSILWLTVVAYVIIAMMVGIAKDPHHNSGTVWTILQGALWPITLLIEAIKRS